MTKHLTLIATLVLTLAGSSLASAAVGSDAIAQQVAAVAGVVKDAAGEPVIGASIMIKGTKTGTVTNLDGEFSLPGVKKGDILEVACLGYATSAAAYGSRSANGVIIITTKKGKSGKPVIRFNTAGSFQTWARKPQLMNGEQWLDAVQQAYNYKDGSFLTDQERLNRSKGIEYNWLDEISRLGYMQDSQASISGASEKVNYYMSLSYTNDKGTIIGDDYNRVSALVKL